MIKPFVVGLGKALFTPILICFVIFSFVYDERMGAKLAELLKPYAVELIPIALIVGIVAMPLLYLNFRTRFYSGIGLGLCGLYLLTISWLECLYWSQHFLNDFFFNAANFIPFIGCLVASIVGLAIKAKWIELGIIIVMTVTSAGCLVLCLQVIEREDLKEAPASAPRSYAVAMGLVWLKTSIWVTFILAIMPMLFRFEENGQQLVTILSASAVYLVLLGLGLAYRWKIALPFAIMSECSMAYAVYGQALVTDWNEPMAAFGAAAPLLLCVIGASSILTLLIPNNLSYYFRPGDER